MSTIGSIPPPPLQLRPPRRPRSTIQKIGIGVGIIVGAYLLWLAGSSLWQGRALSNTAVKHFHEQLNAEQYQAIWDEADEAFRIPEKQQQLLDVLQTVHTKLGSAGVASLTNINVNANSRGTFVTTVYSTVFARDEVVETFTWTKKNDRLKLYGYHVDSKVFATKQ